MYRSPSRPDPPRPRGAEAAGHGVQPSFEGDLVAHRVEAGEPADRSRAGRTGRGARRRAGSRPRRSRGRRRDPSASFAQSTRPLLVVMAHSSRLDEVNSPRSKPASMSGTVIPQPAISPPKRCRNGTRGMPQLRSPAVPDFARRYGPWAVVTGAAQGVGLAFGDALLERGCSVVLVDRQPEVRDVAAARGERPHAPWWPTSPTRRGSARWRARSTAWRSALAVANAAVSFVGRFLDQPAASRHGDGGGELPGHHRAGGVGAAADGRARSRRLRRHQLGLGAGRHRPRSRATARARRSG